MSEQLESPGLESAERPKLSLLENFDQCVDAVILVEKEISRSMRAEDIYTLRNAVLSASGRLREELSFREQEDQSKLAQRNLSGFAGLGGWNRYGVRGDGTITLSESHSTSACVRKARELGIDIEF